MEKRLPLKLDPMIGKVSVNYRKISRMLKKGYHRFLMHFDYYCQKPKVPEQPISQNKLSYVKISWQK